MAEFKDLINENLETIINKQGIDKPTDIQINSIPLILENKDVIASSQTGTGKTLAYLLPLFMKLDKDNKNVQAVVLVPTHELAVQVCKQAELIVKNSEGFYDWVEPALVIGSVNISRQVEKLKSKPRIIIGSVGRLLELINIKKLSAHFIKTIVIDEADRLLDKKNITNTEIFIKKTLRDRQLLLFSASITPETINAAKSLLKEDYKTVSIASDKSLPKAIEHIMVICEFRDKAKYLRKVIHSLKINKGIIFLSGQDQLKVNDITEKLNYHNIKSASLYGDLGKDDRKNAVNAFEKGDIRILICSDIASRGLDFSDVSHIINYDFPENPDIYLHRAGRCGRMGKTGTCVSVATEREKIIATKISKELGITITEKDMKFGEFVEPKLHNKKEIIKHGKR